MTSAPLDNTHGRTTSGMACHYSPWTANRVERRKAWHVIVAFKLADTVGRRRAWHAITAFGQHTQSNDVGYDMPSPLLDNTHDRTTSGIACHHRLWETHTVKRRRAWHAIIAFGSTNGRRTSGVACHHRPFTARLVGRRWAWHESLPLDNTHGRTTSGVA